MLRSGLVSISFRKLSVEQIVEMVAQAGLEGIEWGGDIHAPHGDLARAKEVRRLTEQAGLKVPSYGSYYRVGHEEPVPFEAVLATARELGAPVIRVWAGKQGSDTADNAYWENVRRESRRIADLAEKAGLLVAFEFHGNTLTDTNDSALRLMQTAAHPNLRSYWQPPVGKDEAYCLSGLRGMLPFLSHVHTFSWKDYTRLPLAEHEASWRKYFAAASAVPGDHYAMLEFVADDAPAAFARDAATLKAWLAAV